MFVECISKIGVFLERHFSAGSPQSSKGSLIEDAFTFFAPPVGLGPGREQPPPSSLSALHNGAKSIISQDIFWNFIFTEPNNQCRTYVISRSAHRTPNFTNPEFQFPQSKVLQSVFFYNNELYWHFWVYFDMNLTLLILKK